jgi:hypothetical protein
MTRALGTAGMSSDDTDIDEQVGELFFTPREMPWRRDFEDCLIHIDKHRILEGNGYSKRGAKPTPRRRDPAGEGHTTRRAIPPGLAYDVYNGRLEKKGPAFWDTVVRPDYGHSFRWSDFCLLD